MTYPQPLLLSLITLVCSHTVYAAFDFSDAVEQQEVLQRQREQQLRKQMQPESDVRLDWEDNDFSGSLSQAEPPEPSDEDGICFAIDEVILTGEHSNRFQFALTQALQKTGFQAGKCLNAGDINQIMTAAQNILIGRGYTTTRILAAPQDLNSGKLELALMAGKIRTVRTDLSDTGQSHAHRIAAFQNEFPTRSGRILNLRDLEQGLENLKRIPTAEADIQIVPVEDVPGESDVVVQWRQRLLPYRLTLGIDDSGSEVTGKYQASTTFSADNPLGLSDMFYVSYGRSVGHTPSERDSSGSLKKGRTHNYALHYSVPLGKWTWSFNYSAYRYHQAVAGLNEVYDYNGKSRSADLGFNRLLYRDAKRKTHLGAKLWRKETQSYVNDAEITVQRRKTAGWQVELSHREYIGSNTANFKIAYKRGTGLDGALRAPEEVFGEGTSRMKVWNVGMDVNIPFQIRRQHFTYDTDIRGQWNNTPLTAQDKFSIGGRYSVRGFDGEIGLAAERGWYWRNDLSWHFKQGHQLYVAADMGRVSGPSAKWLLGQTLAGTAVGVRGQMRMGGNLSYDVFAGRGLKKPEYFQTKKWVTGFQMGYSF